MSINRRSVSTSKNCHNGPEALACFYAATREHFGYAGRWWPGSPIEITVTALLVQQCDWSVAYAAAKRLDEAGLLDLQQLAEGDPEAVRAVIHPVSFAPTKSKRLIQIARNVLDQGCDDIEAFLRPASTLAVRKRLLALPGIGEESADCILLYAAGHHPTFVVDAITRRVFQRLALIPEIDTRFWNTAYGQLHEFFLQHVLQGISLSLYDRFSFSPDVPREIAILRDFHAQIVEIGRHHCAKRKPLCQSRGANGWKDYFHCRDHCSEGACRRCPLADLCRHVGPVVE